MGRKDGSWILPLVLVGLLQPCFGESLKEVMNMRLFYIYLPKRIHILNR